MNLFIKQKQIHRLREQIYGYEGVSVGEGIDSEFRIDMYTLLYLKCITNKDLMYSTGNSAQYFFFHKHTLHFIFTRDK